MPVYLSVCLSIIFIIYMYLYVNPIYIRTCVDGV